MVLAIATQTLVGSWPVMGAVAGIGRLSSPGGIADLESMFPHLHSPGGIGQQRRRFLSPLHGPSCPLLEMKAARALPTRRPERWAPGDRVM